MNLVKFSTVEDIIGCINQKGGVIDNSLNVKNPDKLSEHLDNLVFNAYFSVPEASSCCVTLIKNLAASRGVSPFSILPLYIARGKGLENGYTVPAINLRLLTFDIACKIMELSKNLNAGPVIFEIARSEIKYTGQTTEKYAACILAAALKTDYPYPVFLQGDHFQVSAEKYYQNPDEEIETLKDLITRAVGNGFYNIDLDCSTVCNKNATTPQQEQELNAHLTSELIKHTRSLQEDNININIGAEIGEIGGRNSTVTDLHAFMKNLSDKIGDLNPSYGISKISIQTGTSHGGIVLPDGTMKNVNIDFNSLKEIGDEARKSYGMAGAVQHGASTLPVEMFSKFPEVETAEIHLATFFMNAVLDEPLLVEKGYDKLINEMTFEIKGDERKKYFSNKP